MGVSSKPNTQPGFGAFAGLAATPPTSADKLKGCLLSLRTLNAQGKYDSPAVFPVKTPGIVGHAHKPPVVQVDSTYSKVLDACIDQGKGRACLVLAIA
jgi:hypothetical protein